MKTRKNKMAEMIRRSVEADGRSLYAIANAAGVSYQTLHPFIRRQREAITIDTADRLCAVLGLELVQKGI